MEKKLIINSVHVLLKFASLILLHSQMAIGQTNMTIPVKVGVVVDMDVWIGQMGLNCISIALSDIYASNTAFKTRLVLNPRDSKGDDIGAAAAGKTCKFLKLLQFLYFFFFFFRAFLI